MCPSIALRNLTENLHLASPTKLAIIYTYYSIVQFKIDKVQGAATCKTEIREHA